MEIKSMSKSELAWLYSPTLSQTAALNRLNRWINGDPELLAALLATGYRPNQRLLTPKQVKVIVEYLGEPSEVCEIY